MKKLNKVLFIGLLLLIMMFVNGCGKEEEERTVELDLIEYKITNSENQEINLKDESMYAGEDYFLTVNIGYIKKFSESCKIYTVIKLYDYEYFDLEFVEGIALSVIENENSLKEIVFEHTLPNKKNSNKDFITIVIKLSPFELKEKSKVVTQVTISAYNDHTFNLIGEGVNGKMLSLCFENK